MHLFLLNNDPLHTTLLNQDGHALYSISSSPSPSSSSESPLASLNPPPCPAPHLQPPHVHPAIAMARTFFTHDRSGASVHPPRTLDPVPPSKSSTPTPVCQPAAPSTSVKRLRSYECSTGTVEIDVGKIEPMGQSGQARVQLCTLGIEICIPPITKKTETAPLFPPESHTALSRTNDAGIALEAFRDFCVQSQQQKANSAMPASTTRLAPSISGTDKSLVSDPTWSFKGPDDRPYKWISLASNPVLVHDTQPPTPIACFRPAKLGIVSRSRRGFLEILPPGLDKEDWIVVTFVGYFRMKMGDRLQNYSPRSKHEEVQSLPKGMEMTTSLSHHDGNITLAAKLKLMSPPQSPLSKAPQRASLPPAYVEAIRRINRSPIPRRTF